ncbi:MAG: T9SS type A sorting domain-containing protein [Bacteroidales bacterium]|nr:T9SS type A sorting domain-containing protein [Bacteroidales bacterium]NCU34508.1 T9SS type A sorting domain-containing protein [Candidatus Falkowbacteria bacterium]NLO51958.1 T9SS type A sorting domain-containing protein [Bacteroidales bacterium]
MADTLMQETQLASGQNSISLQNLSQGIYLFVVQAGNSVIQNKVVVY